MQLKDVLQLFGVPLFTAILGAIGIFLQNWQQAHNLRNRRKQAREDAEEMIDFIQKWVQAQQLIRTAQELEQEVKPKAREKLDEIYSTLVEAPQPLLHRTEFSPLKRGLLLYTPTGLVSGIAHVLFYLTALLVFFLSLDIVTAPTSAGDFGNTILGYLVFVIPLLGLLLLVRAWAIGIDDRHAQQQSQIQVAPPSAAPPAPAR